MLDKPHVSTADDLPTPPPRRRTARRPAGPPKPVPDPQFEAELQARMQAQLGSTLAGNTGDSSAVTKTATDKATETEPARAADDAATPTATLQENSSPLPEQSDTAAPVDPTGPEAAASVEQPASDESVAEAEGDEVVDTAATEETADPDVPAPEGPTELTKNTDTADPADAADATEPTADTADTDATETEPSDGDEDDAEDSGEEQASTPRRRRRRRGGRRRRRSSAEDTSDSDDADDSDSDDSDTDDTDSDSDEEDNAESDNNGTGEPTGPSRRRRRRRRRRGEDTSGEEDPDTDVVVKVRDPRRTTSSGEVTGIEGSTRMEAKRQRRRESRAAGRRRTPILSEAEFLARRESVDRAMVIRQNDELAQIAVLEDGVLVEHYVDRASATSLIGNVYLGRVQNVLPSMEAAFIDIGRGRNAVLYAGEVDWDSFGAEGQQRKVENVLKSGQTILVQVTKDPVGTKGARLTNNISLPGRYIVYSPGGHLSGISRKLPDTERKRLKAILSELVGEDASVIVRTAAEGSSEEELVRDVNRLKAEWEIIEKKVKSGVAPAQLYAEPDATVRIVRDLFTEDFGKLIIHGNGGPHDAYDTVSDYVSHVAPHLFERMERWDSERGDVFAAHRIDEQIAKALERKVYLPSGGSLVIDRTEAMTVIDVNTGKFTGSGGNLEATVTSNNLEAAEEVVRQLRLRDIGGIIVIDFIDMVLPSNRELLLRRLVECLGRDRTRHQVAEVTSLGLVQMTRKKIGTGLAEAFTETCEACKGRGFEIHEMPVESQSQADGGERRNRRNRSRGGNQAHHHDTHPSKQDDGAKAASQGDSDNGATLDKAAEPAKSKELVKVDKAETSRSTAGRSRRRSRSRSTERSEDAPAETENSTEPHAAGESVGVDISASETSAHKDTEVKSGEGSTSDKAQQRAAEPATD